MKEQAKIGLIGLAVMGENLARNLANNGVATVVYNRTAEKTKDFIQRFGDNQNLQGAITLQEFVVAMEKPRKIILMVKAGEAVDQTINQLLPLLDKHDVIIDGGNSFFADTRRRFTMLQERGIRFVGMGVSGGEEGALYGPSLMPGGDLSAYKELEEILRAIAAKADSQSCVSYVGTDGAGHYVKMVHNGIEYADMQLIAEVYFIMKNLLGMSHGEMAKVWQSWNDSELESYLVEITAKILAQPDEDGSPLLENILDVAGQKGTGKWTSQSALDLGVAIPTVTEAVFARYLSAYKQERVRACQLFTKQPTEQQLDKEQVLADLKTSLYAAKICAYAQGFDLLKAAATAYDWQLNFGEISLLWRSGCIIRARFLEKINGAFVENPHLKNLLLADYFTNVLQSSRSAWVQVVNLSKSQGIAIPALNSALDYFDGYTTDYCSANMLQAQRDYFGAHTYRRLDKAGDFHTRWEE